MLRGREGKECFKVPNEKSVTLIEIMSLLNSGKRCLCKLAEDYIVLVFTLLLPWPDVVLFSC